MLSLRGFVRNYINKSFFEFAQGYFATILFIGLYHI